MSNASTTPKISVVIGTFNQSEKLEKVLAGFNDQTLPAADFEVIVVDSTSTDTTHDMFNRFESNYSFRPIIQENDGKAGARNRGIKEALSPLIFITDADMIPHPNLLETHVTAHAEAKEPCSFEGVTLNMDRYEWPAPPEILHPYIRENLADKAKLGWWYFLTGNISFPKAEIESMGCFDTTFTNYGWEDLELGYRLFQKGFRHYYLKQAINYHYHVISKVEEIDRCVLKGESAAIFYQKHPELKWFLGMNPLSLWAHHLISYDGGFCRLLKRWLKKSGVRKRFAIWFLSEHQYLTGLKKALSAAA